MAIHALLLAAAVDMCNQGSTYDIKMCWSQQYVAADGELHSTYAKLRAGRQRSGIDVPLADAQDAWVATREATCAFEYALYLPGTIAPQLAIECEVRMTRARTRRLATLLSALQPGATRPAERSVSPLADAELNRVYRLYDERLTRAQRAALGVAERTWIRYRDKACAIEGGSCLTELEQERIAELEAAWLGERFW